MNKKIKSYKNVDKVAKKIVKSYKDKGIDINIITATELAYRRIEREALLK